MKDVLIDKYFIDQEAIVLCRVLGVTQSGEYLVEHVSNGDLSFFIMSDFLLDYEFFLKLEVAEEARKARREDIRNGASF